MKDTTKRLDYLNNMSANLQFEIDTLKKVIARQEKTIESLRDLVARTVVFAPSGSRAPYGDSPDLAL